MSLGQRLREVRESKGITIQKAAEDTKVKADILRDLERDDYSKIVAPVYTKGFLKIYAQYLGLDPQIVRDHFEQSNEPARAAQPLHQAAAHLGQSPVDRLISSFATMWGIWLLVGGIVLVLVMIVWLVIATTNRARREAGSVAATTTSVSTTTSIAAPQKRAVSQPAQAPTTTRPSTPAPAAAYIKPMQPRPGMLGEHSSKRPTTTRSSAATAPLNLGVKLTGDCWVEVQVDGRRLPYGTQKAGWENQWQAQKSIKVILGNAAAVRLTVNGQDQGPLGRKGQRIERTFTK